MGESSEVIVLGWWVSMFDVRVRIALADKGIKFEYIQEPNDFPAKKSPLLLKYNPVNKLVPVLIHNGKPVCESKIIVQYIHETWKDIGPSLIPSDPYLRSQATFWADYIDKKIYDGGNKIYTAKREEMAKGVEELMESLKVLEGELGEKPYFNGDSFGYVDLALMSFYSHIKAYEMIANFSFEKEFPKLCVWATKCMQRESVSKTLADPNKVYESLMAFRKANGLED